MTVPSAEELAAVLAALRLRATRPVAPHGAVAGAAAAEQGAVDPLATWRRHRLAVLGQAPRRHGSQARR